MASALPLEDGDNNEIEFVCQVPKTSSASRADQGKSSASIWSPGFPSFNRSPFPRATNFANTNMGRGRSRGDMRGGHSYTGDRQSVPSLLSMVMLAPVSRQPWFPDDRPRGGPPGGQQFSGSVRTPSSNWQIRPPFEQGGNDALFEQRGNHASFEERGNHAPDRSSEGNFRGGDRGYDRGWPRTRGRGRGMPAYMGSDFRSGQSPDFVNGAQGSSYSNSRDNSRGSSGPGPRLRGNFASARSRGSGPTLRGKNNKRVDTSAPVKTNYSRAGPQTKEVTGSQSQALNKVAESPKIVDETSKTELEALKQVQNPSPKNIPVNVIEDDSDDNSQPNSKKLRTDDIETKYCKICEMSYTGSTQEHRQSNEHKIIKAFLNPVCSECELTFDSNDSYSKHCSLVHDQKTESPNHEESEDQEATIDELFFIDKTPAVDREAGRGDAAMDSDSDSVCHKSDDEAAEDSSKAQPKTGASQLADGSGKQNVESPPARDLPDFVVSACYCNICCVFFHDDESVINRHCESRKHLDNIS